MKDFWNKAVNAVKTKGLLYCLNKSVVILISQVLVILAPFFWLLRVRFPVSTNMYHAMGHLAAEPDLYIKEGILGMRPPCRSIFLVTRKDVINRCMLNYWRKYLLFIDLPFLSPFLSKMIRTKMVTYDVDKYFTTLEKGTAFVTIQNRYYPRPALLELTAEDRIRGWEVLKKWGMPEDSWFVCVHGRDGGNEEYRWMHELRNVDINNFVLAMQEIVKRGGWVIRMGDTKMKPLAPMKNVIDYAHLDIKSDWMDIFLCASCKFFLGTASGLINVANVFGRSAVMTNAALPFSGILPYGPEDIGIPKLMWSIKEERYLTFKEIFSSPFANAKFSNFFIEHGIRIDENLPEDIRDVMVEMLDKLEGKLQFSQHDQELQARFKSLMNETHYSYQAMSRVGRDFLRKYEYLL